jgi:hypothetical protein
MSIFREGPRPANKNSDSDQSRTGFDILKLDYLIAADAPSNVPDQSRNRITGAEDQ